MIERGHFKELRLILDHIHKATGPQSVAAARRREKEFLEGKLDDYEVAPPPQPSKAAKGKGAMVKRADAQVVGEGYDLLEAEADEAAVQAELSAHPVKLDV
jgi:hypothetical protein